MGEVLLAVAIAEKTKELNKMFIQAARLQLRIDIDIQSRQRIGEKISTEYLSVVVWQEVTK